MTRTDRLALTAGVIAGVSAYSLWRYRETAAAFVEVADPRGTSPVDVERSLRALREAKP